MLNEKLTNYIKYHNEKNGGVYLFEIEKEYASNHSILEGVILNEDPRLRFQDVVIERCNKENEEMVKKESTSFLEQPLSYLKTHKDEFLFLDTEWFNMIGIDGLSMEIDDVFGNYDAMFGLKLQKKYRKDMEAFLDRTLQGEKSYDLLFNGEDGLWDVNISINDLPSYKEDMSLVDAIEKIYVYLFELIEEAAEKK
jgi:hypothetical protein